MYSSGFDGGNVATGSACQQTLTKSVKLHNNDFVPYIEWKFYLLSWANLQGLAYPAGPGIPDLSQYRDPYIMVPIFYWLTIPSHSFLFSSVVGFGSWWALSCGHSLSLPELPFPS